jgi:hypothetical protein
VLGLLLTIENSKKKEKLVVGTCFLHVPTVRRRFRPEILNSELIVPVSVIR